MHLLTRPLQYTRTQISFDLAKSSLKRLVKHGIGRHQEQHGKDMYAMGINLLFKKKKKCKRSSQKEICSRLSQPGEWQRE